MRFLIFIVSILSISTFVYYHGFIHTAEEKAWLIDLNRSIFLVFILNYIFRLFFNVNRTKFINSTWVEAILLSIMLYDIVNQWLFGFALLEHFFNQIQLPHFISFYTALIQLYLLFLVAKELS